MLDPGEPFVVHARSQAEAAEAARLLWAVGLFEELGYVVSARDATETTQTVTVAELARLLDEEPDTQVLDVREATEHEEARLPGAVELPYREVRVRRRRSSIRRGPVYTVCASGPRATLAASLLARRASTPARGRRRRRRPRARARAPRRDPLTAHRNSHELFESCHRHVTGVDRLSSVVEGVVG